MPPSDQCAVGTDGKLLDPSAIVWYNDPDDSTPITPIAPSLPSNSSALKATTLRPFFGDSTAPASTVLNTGTRRSSRVSKPSKRILDANNMGLDMPKRARVAHKTVVEAEFEDKGDNEGDDEADDEEDDETVSTTHAPDAGGGDTNVEMDSVAAEDAYVLTKVMGDQDRKVGALTIFTLIACSILIRFCLSDRSLIVRPMYALSSNERKSMSMSTLVV